MKIIHILPHNLEDFASADPHSFDHHSVRFIEKVGRFWKIEHPLEALEQELWMLTKKYNTDISVMHTSGFRVRLFPISIKLPLPLEISFPMMQALFKERRETAFYHLHGYYLFMHDFLSFILKIHKKKYAIHFRGGGPSWTFKATAYTLYHYIIGLRFSLNMASLVVIQNKDEVRRATNILWVSPKKILYFPNTVPLESILSSPAKHTIARIVLAGRLDEKLRSTEELLLVFRNTLTNFQECTIHFIGGKSGPVIETLKGEFPGRTFTTGWLQKKDLWKEYGNSDIYIHTNTKPEGSPAALIEAQSQGAAVIAFDVEGVRDMVHNGKDGILVKNYPELEQQLLNVLIDQKLRISLREGALINAREHFTDEKYFPQLIKIYSHLSAQS